MPFNTALSGLRASNADLKVTGNNIANASTAGFKLSRAEFGDVYATAILGAGFNTIGSGVRVQDIAQQFTQGNVSFTENELDLAVSGSGFFVVNQGGDQLYTRAGTFGLDKDGYIVNNVNARLQGFSANADGVVNGVLGDMQIRTGNQPPRQTTDVESLLNLDAQEEVLQREGTTFSTDGNAIGVTQTGLQTATFSQVDDTTANVSSVAYPGANFDFTTGTFQFDITMSGASSGNNGTVSITLNGANGVPQNINNYNDARTLAGVINAQIFSPTAPQTPIDVLATAVDDGGGNFHIEFRALQSGEASQITLSNGTAAGNRAPATPAVNADIATYLGLPVTGTTATDNSGTPAVNNGYPVQTIDITDPDGDTITYSSNEFASAAQTASELNALEGVRATATTQATILGANYQNLNGNMVITLNNVALTANTLADLATEINALTTSTLPGVSAAVDAATGNLVVTSSTGNDLNFEMTSTDDADRIEIQGNSAAPSQVLEWDTAILPAAPTLTAGASDARLNGVTVGGSINIILDEGFTASDPNPPAIGLFGPFTNTTFQPSIINAFDPTDQNTYNHSTSVTVYDSLGNSHVVTQYFVKQDYDPNDATTNRNHWQMFVLIDGEDVGDPDTTLAPPQNTEATRAVYNLHFNQDGTLNELLSDDVLISNWVPVDSDGNPTGALGPQNRLQGGTLPIPEPATSSNFEIDMTGTTQFGSDFAVNSVDQNGFTTGRLSGISITSEGFVQARFTNGESQTLGQVVLADFANRQGLQPVGDTMWAENFESGVPNIGAPGTAALGAVQSGAIEESNVDLSEQLVNLIIAQRNFQANSKTIETANQTTQTIINLR